MHAHHAHILPHAHTHSCPSMCPPAACPALMHACMPSYQHTHYAWMPVSPPCTHACPPCTHSPSCTHPFMPIHVPTCCMSCTHACLHALIPAYPLCLDACKPTMHTCMPTMHTFSLMHTPIHAHPCAHLLHVLHSCMPACPHTSIPTMPGCL